MDMRSNNRPPRKFSGKPGGRPTGGPGGKPNWRAEGGKPEGGRPEGKPNWSRDDRPAPRFDGKPAGRRDGDFAREPGGRPDGKPDWKAGGKPRWNRDDRPARPPEDGGFDRADARDGKPKWNPKGRPGRTAGQFEGRSNWDPDNRPGRRPEGRPTGRPEGKPFGRPEWNRDDRPARPPEDGGFDRADARDGKPKWNPKGRPGRPAGKFEGRTNWDPDNRPGRRPEGRPTGRPEGKPFGRPEWNRDDRPTSQPEDRPFGRPQGGPDGKPKWSPKERPAGRPSDKSASRPDWGSDARPERTPKWNSKKQSSKQYEHKPIPTPADEQKPAVAGAPQPKEQPTHWGNVAEWYDELVGDEGSEYHQEVIIPGLLKMLNLTQGGGQLPRVLDLACGQGVLCRRLAEYGCPTTGVDAAEELISSARKRNEEDNLDIRYIVADATQLIDDNDQLLPIIERESYDAVTIVLSIQNITPLTPVWLACRQALKPGGHLIVVMMHPCFRVPRRSDWFWNSANSTQSRLVSLYLSSDQIEIQTHPGLAAHGKDTSSTTHFHRPLQAYINTLGSAGLLVDHIEEWPSHKTEQPGPKKVAIDRARKEIPMFLALRMRKV